MAGERNESQETVWWINRFSEKGIRKILEKLSIVEPIKQPALTTIPADGIDSLGDEGLKEALRHQLQQVREDAPAMEVPVAFMPEERLSHSWSVLRRSAADRVIAAQRSKE